jgi:hypothetical protein
MSYTDIATSFPAWETFDSESELAAAGFTGRLPQIDIAGMSPVVCPGVSIEVVLQSRN